MEEKTEMDAFKELMVKSPDMEMMSIGDLHGMVFWAGAATKWANLQISMAETVGGMHEQIAAWRKDGQAAAELDFKATQRLGEIAKKEPQETTAETKRDIPGSGGGRTGKVPKWQRLGFKSDSAMKEAEFLANHPKEAKEVIEQAKAADDFPSRTAVKNRVTAKKAEQRAKEAEERAAEKKETAVDKRVEENKRFVKEYFSAVYD